MNRRLAGRATMVTIDSAISSPPRISQAARRLFTRSAMSTSGKSAVAVVLSGPGTRKIQRHAVSRMKSEKKSASSWPTMKSGRGIWFRTPRNDCSACAALKPLPSTSAHIAVFSTERRVMKTVATRYAIAR